MISTIMLNAAIAAFGSMFLLWLLSIKLHNVSIVDSWWGPGFVLIAWVTFFTAGTDAPRQYLLLALVTLWGLRLGTYITWRNKGEDEDYRYRRMRKNRDGFWWQSLFIVFWLQASLMWIISTPLQLGQLGDLPAALTWSDWLGVLFFAVGFFFETVGDWQLARFKADPQNKGKVMDSGVWRYTRHPNYFGDVTQWWGFYLIAAGSIPGCYSIIGPIVMTFFLLKVSGVAMMDKDQSKKKPEYAEYIRKTSAFIPLPPKG